MIFGVPAARCAGVKNLVYTSHSNLGNNPWRLRLCSTAFLKAVPRVVAVSEAAKRVLVSGYGVPPTKVEVIYNGVNLEKFSPRATAKEGTRDFVIGFCGLFRPEKQLPVLLRAFKQLRTTSRHVRLLLVGDGVEMSECRRLTAELDLGEVVEFAGMQADVEPFLQRMDLLVLPSSTEAMPMAVIEAMAMGKPVVASAVGGLCEIIEDGVSGLLVEPGNVEQLVDRLSRLLGDTELRSQFERAARNRVEELFSEAQMFRRYERVYSELARR